MTLELNPDSESKMPSILFDPSISILIIDSMFNIKLGKKFTMSSNIDGDGSSLDYLNSFIRFLML